MLRALSFTRWAMAVTSARLRSSSAAAPAIFSTTSVAPTPRRPAVYRLSCTATSSLTTIDATSTPVSAAASSAAISKFMMSPV